MVGIGKLAPLFGGAAAAHGGVVFGGLVAVEGVQHTAWVAIGFGGGLSCQARGVVGFVGGKTAHIGAQAVAQTAAVVLCKHAVDGTAQVVGVGLVECRIHGTVATENIVDNGLLGTLATKKNRANMAIFGVWRFIFLYFANKLLILQRICGIGVIGSRARLRIW